ncbi:DUF805 domain-containing protein [Clostridium botulinum]|uniref:DUF805 domain-containing protein n=1 Tax=Clostridium botulinum TaxID=1491 RepID=UPI0006A483BF|nr:DUF805 domain-containing protein [Clostridium botulinum]KOC31256.1 hypothetical protein ADU81_14065 [Clostridium botulinum]
MHILKYYKKCMSKYITFCGRATRKEYWYFTLSNILISLSLSMIWMALTSEDLWDNNPLRRIYLIIIFIPSLTVSIRRLHDINRSGWWILLCLIPFINIILLLCFCVESDEGSNKYGIIEIDDDKKDIGKP